MSDETPRGNIPSIEVNTLNDLLTVESKALGDKFKDAVMDDSTYSAKLAQIFRLHTIQGEFIAEALTRLNPSSVGSECEISIVDPDATPIQEEPEEGEEPEPPKPVMKTVRIGNQSVLMTAKNKGKELSGKQARYMILAKGNNVKRFNLYNSGFSIVLRTPTLSEINLAYTQIEEDLDKYGKIFGAAFFMYNDLYIKQILWDFIYSLTLDSNLKGWNKGNNLMKSVSFLDYNLLLLHIGNLMFNHGYPMTEVCENADCRNITETTVDLGELQLTDFSKVPEELLSNFHTTKLVTIPEAKTYRATMDKIVTFEGSVAGYKITPKIPSMYEYLKYGDKFNEELTMAIQDIAVKRQLDEYLIFNYSRLYFPWVSSVSAIDEDGEVAFSTSDQDVFKDILDDIQANEETLDTFRKMMNVYIQDSTTTLIGYPEYACPKCGQKPSNAVKGFIPFDSQQHFFDQMAIRLL